MGPFPHNAPKAEVDNNSITGTDGFGFVKVCTSGPRNPRLTFKTWDMSQYRNTNLAIFRSIENHVKG